MTRSRAATRPTVLVTGGTGLLGRHVLQRLADARTYAVVALHRPGAAPPPPMTNVTWVEQDLARPLASSLPDRVDTVIHLAQSRHHREFPAGAVETFDVGAAATVRLLDYCRRSGGGRFVLASSGAVYPPSKRPLSESDRLDPRTFHGVSKVAAEHAACSFRSLFSVQILRFFFIYGRDQEPGAFMPGVVSRVRERSPVELTGRDGMHCNPIHVEDAAGAVHAATRLDHSTIVNVAGPDIVSLRDIAVELGQLLGAQARFAVAPGISDLIGDTTLMREQLVTPRVHVRDRLPELL